MADTSQTAWDDAPLPYQSLSPDGILLAVNSAWEQLTGYSADEVIGRPYRELIPEDHLEDFEEAFRLFAEQGYLRDHLCYIRRKDGETRNIRIHGRMGTRDGQPVSNCMLVDVSDHLRTREALAESEQRYRSLFELAPNPIVIHDGRTIVMANDVCADFLGYDGAGDLIGQSVAGLVAEESRPAVAERVGRMMTEDWVAPLEEETYIRKDGTTIVGNTIAAPVVVDGRRMIHVAAIDDSERQAALGALMESEKRFKQLFESSVDPIVVHDGVHVLLANPAALEAFGLSDTEAAGVDIRAYIHSDHARLASERLSAFFSGEGRVSPLELHLLRSDNTDWYAEVTSSLIDLDGRAVAQTVFRDLTERRRSALQLEKYRRQLEELLEERTKSLVQVRAELKSVTAVIGRTVELRDPYTAGHQRRVSELAVAIARELDMDERDIDEIRVAADLHDIGKISVPAEILSKPGRFSALEYEFVKTHAQAGYEIIASAEIGGSIADLVWQHHERLDGSGYPQGLSGSQLLPGALVLQVADVVEAMASHRPYRPSLGVAAALDEVRSGRGDKFGTSAVDACVAVFDAGFTFVG